MARPTKQGLEYFPMDVDADTDEALEYVIAKRGFIAFGVYVRLLMGIYKDGYYTEWNERKLFVYAKRMMMETETLSAIISDFVAAGLFSQEMLAKGILTSASIQKRYLAATEKRKTAGIAEAYALISAVVNSEKTTDEKELIPKKLQQKEINSELTPQSKVKESKVNNNNTNVLSPPQKGAGGYEKEQIPYGEIVEHYKRLCPSLPIPSKLNTARKTQIKARWKNDLHENFEEVDAFFRRVESSDFLTGRNGARAKPFGIDWIFKEQNFLKIQEGNYSNKTGPSSMPHTFDDDLDENFGIDFMPQGGGRDGTSGAVG